MTLNNLAEQLPWLLRNPKATRPATSSASSSSSSSTGPSPLARPSGPSSSALLTPASTSHSPTTAALISSFRKDPPLPSSSLTATATATPRASNAAALPTPVSTGTTLVQSLRPTLLANADARGQSSPAVARNAAGDRLAKQPPLPPFPPFISAAATSMASNPPSRRPQQQQQQQQQQIQPPQTRLAPPAAARGLATPARGKTSALAGSAKTPSRTTPALPSSHMKRARTPAAPSPYAFDSDIDLDDFDSIVDLTTDDNTPSSSSPGGAPHEDIRLWREDYASRPEPSSKRSKKRKSDELSGSPAKNGTANKRKARADEEEPGKVEEDGDDADSVGDFPDINDLISLGASSPAMARRAPAKTPKKSSLKPTERPSPTPIKSATPQKKQKRESVRSDVVMDSEDEFVTPPTRNASFVTCPNDTTLDEDEPPSPHSPTLQRAESRVADTPNKYTITREATTPMTTEPVPEECGDINMESGGQGETGAVENTAPTSSGRSTATPTTMEPARITEGDDEEDMESTQRPSILTYWPALRWKQQGLDEKIRQNTADYMKALREKWPPARRMKIKGEKGPLLNEKQTLDSLVDELQSYARLYNDQEALLHSITEAYQNHQDTEAEEARLDELSVELQESEDALRAQLSAAGIDPASCPSDFEAGSPHNIVVPATQHPDGYVPPMLSRNNTIVSESPSQIVLQTQMPPPRQTRSTASWDEEFSRAPPPPAPRQADSSSSRYMGANNNIPDYFDDEDLFREMENLPPMSYSNFGPGAGVGSSSGPGSARAQNGYSFGRSPARPPPAAARGHDLFSDFSDDVEMLQVAEDFEMQHSSSAETSSRRAAPSRPILAPTSSNAVAPPKEPARGTLKKLANSNQKASIPPELMRFEWSQDVRRALKDRFRMSGFRHNQLEAINATLSGGDAFVLMPTGGGKSLCYQLPAVIGSGKTHGVTIVISPLLSLMQDQVDHLKALNIAASAFNSSTPAAARKLVLALFSKPNPEHFLQLLYVTPEMVNKSTQFCNGLATLYRNRKLARIVIDEAHCVSQWGHDFRPDYKALGTVRRQFPSVPVMALTATATPNVIVDIKHNLSIDGCKVFSQSFNRPNLYYEIREKGKGCVESIAELINSQYSGQTGIVYTLSQKSTVSIAEKLRMKFGISAHHYHAAIGADEKAQIQRDWQQGRIKVVVATIAFGMGIDKPDVRFVVHHYLPKSLEGYYQETGRAGRDGAHSDCFLYFSYGDIKNLRKFITDSDASEEQKQRQREMLNRMVDFCENKRDCRRSEILRYFGEDFDKAGCESTCDNCKSGGKFDLTDFTEYAVAALRVVQEYGLITMVQCGDILQGKKRPEHASLESVYGIAKKLKKHDIHMMIYRLLGESALKEENRVNRMDIAIQYFSLGHCARDFFSGKKELQVVIKVGGDIAAAVTEKAAKKTKAAAGKSGDKADKAGSADKPAKKGKAAKGKAVAGPSNDASSAKKKRRGAAAAVLDEAEVDDDDEEDGGGGDSEFENFEGPMHANGYAKDNFVVSDNDEDVAEEEGQDDHDDFDPPPKQRSNSRAKPPRQALAQQHARQDPGQASASRGQKRSHQTPQRQRRLEELGGPIARDPRLAEANVDPIHADIIAAFADEARRLEEKIRNEKGMRVLFTESHLREMAIGWTDSLDKMRRIPDINADHVRRYGARFLPLVSRYFSMYQEMMGYGADEDGGGGGGGDESPLLGPVTAARRGGHTSGSGGGAASSAKAPSRSDLDAVVDLISSDEDDDDENDYESEAEEEGGGPSATESREARQWRAQLETLQSQSGKSGGGSGGGRSSGGGGSRKNWGGGGGGRRTFSRRGGSRSGSGSYFRKASGGGGGGGVTKRRAAGGGGSSTGAASAAASRSGGSSRASGGASGGASGIGMMPL